ncbi:hypothetical protein P3T39_007198 [Kitasatospora sp. GP82]|nr:hypothetical protein [Kitasatospora sp. GP82]
MALGTVVSRATGLIRLVLQGSALGTALVATTYNTANTVPMSLYALLIGGTLNAAFVPQLVRARMDHADGGRAHEQRLMTLVLCVLGVGTVAAVLAAPQIVGLTGWPVKTPSGRPPLPREARVLKALDRDAIFALYEEAGHLRLGLGAGSPWLRAHLDPSGPHYLFPDPADYYWPDAGRRWWQCRVLLRMVNGEQVSGSVAMLPETFTALPSTLPRLRQRRLAHIARATERDSYLWGRDHKTHCGPEECGYLPAEAKTGSP